MDSYLPALRFLRFIRRGLLFRKFVSVLIDTFLVISCAAVLMMPVMWAKSGFFWWSAVTVFCGGVALCWFWRRISVSPVMAALLADKALGGQERFVSIVELDAERSRFASVLTDSVNEFAREAEGEIVLGPILPSRAPYLAIPVAIVCVALLLGNPFGETESRDADTPLVSSPDNVIPQTVSEQQKAERLGHSLEDELERMRNGGKADRAQRLTSQLEDVIATLESGHDTNAVNGQANGDVGDGAGDGDAVRAGRHAELLRLKILMQRAESVFNNKNRASAQGEQPDWQSYGMMSASVPLDRRDHVDAYLRGLVTLEEK